MSIKVAYRNGVFEPLEKVEGAQPGAIYTAFSDEELRDFLERLRTGNVRAFLDLRNEIAADAAARGLTHERLAEILSGDDA
jgi:predicted DNA-binding antitoxin AbrB/MazE fold protein